MSDKDWLADGKEAFRLSSEAEKDQRIQSLDDMRFARLGEQWPGDVAKQRQIEGRPCLTLNRMPAFCKQVINDARQNRPAIKCHPVGSGASRETAEILDGLIRNIEYVSNADVAYDTALECSVYGGLGYVVVRTDYASEDSFDQDIVIEAVHNPFSVYGDPYATGADSADWNDGFITDLLDKESYKRRWPNADISDFDTKRDNRDLLWQQGNQIQVAEWWHRDEVAGTILKLSDGTVLQADEFEAIKDLLMVQGVTVTGNRAMRTHKVTQRIMSGAEILETNEWKGKYIPIVPVYGEMVNIEGKRHFLSLIHFAKDSQRQYNYWRTTTTELVALAPKAPFIGAVGAFDTDKKWSSANTVSHPYLEYDKVDGASPPQRQGFTGPPAGAIQEALSASDDMKNIMGIHDASLGARSNETSGRAIIARQREGDVSTFNYIDNLSRGIRHVGRIIIDLIPHHYNAARIIRCIKEDGSNFSVPINQPVVPAQQPQQGPVQQQVFQPAPPGADQMPELAAITKVFDLTTGKYDVTVEVGPSYTTRREESASQMLEFMRLLPNAAPLLGDLLAKNLDWPGADEIAKRLHAMLPPPVLGQNPAVMQLQEALKQQDGQARQALGNLQQELQKCQAMLADKTREMSLKEYEAVSGRIEALAQAVKDGVQLTQDAEGNLQAVPLMRPQMPSPDTVIDAGLRQRDQQLEGIDLALKAQKQAVDHRIGGLNAATDHIQAMNNLQTPMPATGPVSL